MSEITSKRTSATAPCVVRSRPGSGGYNIRLHRAMDAGSTSRCNSVWRGLPMLRPMALIACLCAVGGGQVGQATEYTWNGANANWDVWANWSAAGPLTDTDAGIIESGQVRMTTTNTFAARLRLMPGGTLFMDDGYGTRTVDELHFEGGTLKGWNNYGSTYIEGTLVAVEGTTSLINPNSTPGAWGAGLMTIRAPISGGGDLHVTGFKSVALDADNSGFSGTISVTGGVVVASRAQALGTGSVNATNGGTITAKDGGITNATVNIHCNGSYQLEGSSSIATSNIITTLHLKGGRVYLVGNTSGGISRYLRGDVYLDADSSFEGSPTTKGEALHCYSTLRGSTDLRLLGAGPARFTTSLYADNADTFSGDVVVGSFATLSPEHMNALGSGTVYVDPGGVLLLRTNNWTRALTLRGGTVQESGTRYNYLGAMTLASATTSTVWGASFGTVILSNDVAAVIIGHGAVRLGGSGTGSGGVAIRTANTYTGGTIVDLGTIQVYHTDALGNGPVSLAYPTSVLQVRLNGIVAMTNDVSGLGSIQLGDSGTAAYGLIIRGAKVDPGSSVTNGILRVAHVGGVAREANFAFAKNGDRNATFVVDILGGQAVAGADYDQLSLTNGTAGGFANADLCVKIAPDVTEESLEGDVLTIVKCTADLSAAPSFASVTFTEGWTGVVRYNADGTVTIESIRKKGGTTFVVR